MLRLALPNNFCVTIQHDLDFYQTEIIFCVLLTCLAHKVFVYTVQIYN